MQIFNMLEKLRQEKKSVVYIKKLLKENNRFLKDLLKLLKW